MTDIPERETDGERRRLEALRSYDVLDTAPESDFDDVAALAARLCDTPTALVSLVDADRQWFKARVGLDATETPRSTSFCAQAMIGHDVLVVPDATLDPRFADNALVTGPPYIRFYAGAPLVSSDGYPLGSLCVIDYQPRMRGLSSLQVEALAVLARQVMSQLELRRAIKHDAAEATSLEIGADQARRNAAAARHEARGVELAMTAAALAHSEARFRAIADSMPQMVWSTLPDGFHDYYNARWYEFTGVPEGSTDGEAWNGMFHPEDQERAWARWRQSLSSGEPYEIEYRLRHHSGVYRWTLGRALPIRDADGHIARWFGTCTDIDDLKRMEQAKELLSHELSHRIKNIFAVVSALVALSARQFPEAKAFAQAFRTRVAALAQAHEFVRPHTESSAPSVGSMTLHAFLAALFSAYVDADGHDRIRISGEDAVFDDQAATPLALLFHELATNAAKYGALTTETGRVDLVTGMQGDRFVLTWTETGGPRIDAEPERVGFGSSLATLSVEGQLGGRLAREWRPEGLKLTADLPQTALSRRRAALQSEMQPDDASGV